MGDLAKLYSRVTSTLEVLEKLGVQPDDWDAVRKEPLRAQAVADAFRRNLKKSSKGPTHSVPTFVIPGLPRVSASEILRKYGFKSVERDNSPTKEVIFSLQVVLREDATSISGQEYELWLQSVAGQLGLSQALWLLEHQEELQEFMALLREINIDFPATIVVDRFGDRCVPCFGLSDRRGSLYWSRLSHGCSFVGRVAVSYRPGGLSK